VTRFRVLPDQSTLWIEARSSPKVRVHLALQAAA